MVFHRKRKRAEESFDFGEPLIRKYKWASVNRSTLRLLPKELDMSNDDLKNIDHEAEEKRMRSAIAVTVAAAEVWREKYSITSCNARAA